MARSSRIYQPSLYIIVTSIDKSVTVIKRMGKFDWCAVIEKQWCNLWKRQNGLSLHFYTSHHPKHHNKLAVTHSLHNRISSHITDRTERQIARREVRQTLRANGYPCK